MLPQYQEKYTQLVSIFHDYLRIISKDHHKNRDGDLSIGYHYWGWDFNGKGEWRVIHNGYVNDFIISDEDLDIALDKAIIEMEEMLQEARDNEYE